MQQGRLPASWVPCPPSVPKHLAIELISRARAVCELGAAGVRRTPVGRLEQKSMLSTLLRGLGDMCVGYFAQLPRASPSNPRFRPRIAQILHAHGHGRMCTQVGGRRRRCLPRRNVPHQWSYQMLLVLPQPTASPHAGYPPVRALLAPEICRQRGCEKGVERRHSGPASGAALSAREQVTSYVAQ